jgi:hypothetical protein
VSAHELHDRLVELTGIDRETVLAPRNLHVGGREVVCASVSAMPAVGYPWSGIAMFNATRLTLYAISV